MKSLIYIGATIGGIAGAYIPALWGDSNMFSGWSLLMGAIGGVIGIYVGYKIQENLGD